MIRPSPPFTPSRLQVYPIPPKSPISVPSPPTSLPLPWFRHSSAPTWLIVLVSELVFPAHSLI